MTKWVKTYIIKYLIYLAILVFVCMYLSLGYGFWHGLHLTALIWSFYILCIPGAHGQLAFGFPLQFITHKPLHTEPFVWSAALLLNIITYTYIPKIYVLTFPSCLLYRILTTPNPYWLILLFSALGTFYYFIVGEKPFRPHSNIHRIIRHLIVIFALLAFIYLSHKEIIILFNARI